MNSDKVVQLYEMRQCGDNRLREGSNVLQLGKMA